MIRKSPLTALCPCGSQHLYMACCGRFIEQNQNPETPELLMRSRYTAFTQANMKYIRATMSGKALSGFHEHESQLWAGTVKWIGLQVIQTFPELSGENLGFVEFVATFEEEAKQKVIHEKSEFQRHAGKWYYVDGLKPKKPVTARNNPCPCGSLKKYKNCHGR